MSEPRLQLERVSRLQTLQTPQQVRILLGAAEGVGGGGGGWWWVGGGVVSGVAQQQLQRISQKTFHQPNGGPGPPLPSPPQHPSRTALKASPS